MVQFSWSFVMLYCLTEPGNVPWVCSRSLQLWRATTFPVHGRNNYNQVDRYPCLQGLLGRISKLSSSLVVWKQMIPHASPAATANWYVAPPAHSSPSDTTMILPSKVRGNERPAVRQQILETPRPIQRKSCLEYACFPVPYNTAPPITTPKRPHPYPFCVLVLFLDSFCFSPLFRNRDLTTTCDGRRGA